MATLVIDDDSEGMRELVAHGRPLVTGASQAVHEDQGRTASPNSVLQDRVGPLQPNADDSEDTTKSTTAEVAEEGLSMLTVNSQDGTRIAYEQVGGGPALVLVGGSLADHQFYTPLAEQLAQHFTVYNVDRRGRGESGDTPPYAPQREVEDLAAVIDAAGGTARVYGHSAGSAVALRAASAGLSISRLVLADPPFSPPADDAVAAREDHAAQARRIERFNAAGDYRSSVKFFLSDYGLPEKVLEEMLNSEAGSMMVTAARALPYDYAVLGDGLLPLQAATGVTMPTLVVADGNDSATARALADTILTAEFAPARASTHELAADEIAELVGPFLLRS